MDEKVLTLFLAVVCLSTAVKKWKFVEKGENKKTLDETQLKKVTVDSVETCAIYCVRTQYCQSISYNTVIQQCLLQFVLSDHHQLLIVDGPGFTIWDRTPPLEGNETKPVSLCLPSELKSNTDSAGNDISYVLTLENNFQCCDLCKSNPGCVAYLWNQILNRCWTKYAVGVLTVLNNHDLNIM